MTLERGFWALTIGGAGIILITTACLKQAFTPWRKTTGLDSQIIVSAVDEKRGDTITIISWTPRFLRKNGPWFKEGRRAFNNCTLPAGAMCEYFHNQSLYRSSDAVLFSGRFLRKIPLPRYRSPDQFWIFSERESPVQTWAVIDLKPFAKLFNASMTYSRKSDIAQPHGMCSRKLPNRSKSEDILPDIASKKTELAAWFVSHCPTRSRREKYVEELTRHIPVHIYGKCGQYNCSKDSSEECNQLLKRKYKFYLAFENSLCEGYMTEKFWKCFELDIIPVVYGLGAYGLYAPNHSFIDVREFASPKHLADYLLLLDKNNTLYDEYFAWKSTYKCGGGSINVPCQLCEMLHKRKNAKQSYPPLNVAKEWGIKPQCQDPETFRKKCNCWPR